MVDSSAIRNAATVTLNEQLTLRAFEHAAQLASALLQAGVQGTGKERTTPWEDFRADADKVRAAAASDADAASAGLERGRAADASLDSCSSGENSVSASLHPVDRAIMRAGDRTVYPLVRAFLRIRHGCRFDKKHTCVHASI